MTKMWSVVNALRTDPQPEVASAMQSLVTRIKQKAKESEPVGKRAKKSVAAKEEQKRALLLKRESFLDRSIRDFRGDAGAKTKDEGPKQLVHKKQLDDEKENDSTFVNGTMGRNPTLPLLNHQLRSFQTQRAPELIRFGMHQQLAMAFKDRVLWQSYTEHNCHVLKPPSHSGDSSNAVTSLLFNVPLISTVLLVGHSDGAVRLWQSNSAAPNLVSAWQALYEPDNVPPSNASSLLMTAFDRTLVAAGEAKYLRMWELEKEVMVGDIVSGTDQAITAITCSDHRTVAIGTADGSVRLFDLRVSGAAGGKAAMAPKHAKSVRTISLRNDGVTMVSGCLAGSFTITDMRKLTTPTKNWTAGSVVADVAIHDQLELVACAGDVIDVYSTDGEQLYAIDRMENGAEVGSVGGGKKRPPCCVAFHPNDRLMCAGYRDNTAVLYDHETNGKEGKEA